MVVVARDANVPHIDVDSVSLLETNDPSCTPVDYTAAFAIFQFPMTACGTILKVASAVLFFVVGVFFFFLFFVFCLG